MAESKIKNIGNLEVLWTNSNPNISFSAQTISLSKKPKYNHILIVFKLSSNAAYLYSKELPYGTQNGYRIDCNSGLIRYRNMSINSTNNTISFDVGYSVNNYASAPTEDNSCVIPYKIYG